MGKSTAIHAALVLIQKEAGNVSIFGREEMDNETKVTCFILNIAQRKLSNDMFLTAGVAQKYTCALVWLDDRRVRG